ncbi:gamma-aminobutyric acid receptor subunit gamma-1-like [Acropora muricata]|uniref:gamma-aminobutyric acid receptor subunit gamma-1-like n=1 Tax=Acropora muricata TaxID=159855 RepID=UPI0034E420A1
MIIQPAFGLILLWFCGVTNGDSEVIATFFKGYDRAIRPNIDDGRPTIVRSSIYVESFGNTEEANMEYKVYAYFRQFWTDARLAGKLNRTMVLQERDIDRIWHPDPYCINARESNLMIPNDELNSFVKVQPSGEVMMSNGMTIIASCVLKLHNFPLDSQKCHLEIGSYAYSVDDIVYEWIPGEVGVGHKEMAQFEYKGAQLTSDFNVFSMGNYSSITVTFLFRRRIGFFLIQVYLPAIFVVMLSWIVFWMEKDDIGNRMGMGLTTVLTIMFLLGSLNGNLPKVSYPKALDWYLLVSFTFVFLSLMECVIVYLFVKNGKDQKMKCKTGEMSLTKGLGSSVKSLIARKTNSGDSETADGHANMGVEGGDLELAFKGTNDNKEVLDDCSIQENKSNKRLEKTAASIDNISRVLFPLSFVVYNIYYFVCYYTD